MSRECYYFYSYCSFKLYVNSIFQRDLSLICVFLSSSMFLFSQIFFIDLYFSCCFSFKFCVFLLFRDFYYCFVFFFQVLGETYCSGSAIILFFLFLLILGGTYCSGSVMELVPQSGQYASCLGIFLAAVMNQPSCSASHAPG